jgi:hypothetical protein
VIDNCVILDVCRNAKTGERRSSISMIVPEKVGRFNPKNHRRSQNLDHLRTSDRNFWIIQCNGHHLEKNRALNLHTTIGFAPTGSDLDELPRGHARMQRSHRFTRPRRHTELKTWIVFLSSKKNFFESKLIDRGRNYDVPEHKDIELEQQSSIFAERQWNVVNQRVANLCTAEGNCPWNVVVDTKMAFSKRAIAETGQTWIQRFDKESTPKK